MLPKFVSICLCFEVAIALVSRRKGYGARFEGFGRLSP
jgi:hypothetical protein